MLYVHTLARFNLVHVRAAEPFNFSELEEHGRAAALTGRSQDLSMPSLFDFRGVTLIREDTALLTRVIARRQRFANRTPNNHVAFVVRDEHDFGMMRMYTSLAAARGLRDLDHALVTLDIAEAAAWLLEHVDAPATSTSACLLAELDPSDATGSDRAAS